MFISSLLCIGEKFRGDGMQIDLHTVSTVFFFLCILVLLPVLDSCSCLSKLVYNTKQYCLARNSQWLNSDLSMFCIVWKTQEPHDDFSLLFFWELLAKKIYINTNLRVYYIILYIYTCLKDKCKYIIFTRVS